MLSFTSASPLPLYPQLTQSLKEWAGRLFGSPRGNGLNILLGWFTFVVSHSLFFLPRILDDKFKDCSKRLLRLYKLNQWINSEHYFQILKNTILGSAVKPPAMQEPQEMGVRSLGREDSLEEGMATHSSILAWKIPWTEEPGSLQGRKVSDRLKQPSPHNYDLDGW